MFRRELGMLPRDRLALYEFGAHEFASARVSQSRFRNGRAYKHELRKLDASVARLLLRDRHRRFRREIYEPSRAKNESHTLHRMERLGDSAESGTQFRHQTG